MCSHACAKRTRAQHTGAARALIAHVLPACSEALRVRTGLCFIVLGQSATRARTQANMSTHAQRRRAADARSFVSAERTAMPSCAGAESGLRIRGNILQENRDKNMTTEIFITVVAALSHYRAWPFVYGQSSRRSKRGHKQGQLNSVPWM